MKSEKIISGIIKISIFFGVIFLYITLFQQQIEFVLYKLDLINKTIMIILIITPSIILSIHLLTNNYDIRQLKKKECYICKKKSYSIQREIFSGVYLCIECMKFINLMEAENNRKCFNKNCGCKINLIHVILQNENIEINKIFSMWKDKRIQFYCCTCFGKALTLYNPNEYSLKNLENKPSIEQIVELEFKKLNKKLEGIREEMNLEKPLIKSEEDLKKSIDKYKFLIKTELGDNNR